MRKLSRALLYLKILASCLKIKKIWRKRIIVWRMICVCEFDFGGRKLLLIKIK